MNSRNKYGYTALMEGLFSLYFKKYTKIFMIFINSASANGHMEIVKKLVNLHANVNTCDDLGSDALIKGNFINLIAFSK